MEGREGETERRDLDAGGGNPLNDGSHGSDLKAPPFRGCGTRRLSEADATGESAGRAEGEGGERVHCFNFTILFFFALNFLFFISFIIGSSSFNKK